MIHQMIVTQFGNMLRNLRGILDKAAVHAETMKFEIEVLLQARLTPNQFDFIRQEQVACDAANLGAARLADKEQETPSRPDTEQSLVEIRMSLQRVIT